MSTDKRHMYDIATSDWIRCDQIVRKMAYHLFNVLSLFVNVKVEFIIILLLLYSTTTVADPKILKRGRGRKTFYQPPSSFIANAQNDL